MDPLEVGSVAEDGERDPVAERGPRGLGLVRRVRGDLFRISTGERDPEHLDEAVFGAVDVGRPLAVRRHPDPGMDLVRPELVEASRLVTLAGDRPEALLAQRLGGFEEEGLS